MLIVASKNSDVLFKVEHFFDFHTILLKHNNYLVVSLSNSTRAKKIELDNKITFKFLPCPPQQATTKQHKIVVTLDLRDEKLQVQRDWLGYQHVFYKKSREYFLVSTSLKTLVKANILLGKKFDFDDRGIQYYLTFQYIPFPKTIIRGVLQIPPGATLILHRSQFIGIKKPLQRKSSLSNFNPIELPGLIKEALVKSLEGQIGNKEVIGCYLSGGMDTSTNVALLVSRLQVQPLAFTASFAERQYDEAADAKLVANEFGLKHSIIEIKPECILSLKDIAKNFDLPIADRAVLPQYFVTEEAKKANVSLMFSGEGGDEIFGYPRRLSIIMGQKIAYLAELSNLTLAKYYLRHAKLFSQKSVQRLLGKCNKEIAWGQALTEVYRDISNIAENNFDRIYKGQWRTWLIDNVLVKDRSICDAMGIRLATPFIDIKVMERMSAVPIEEKLVMLKNKWLLKQIMVGVLPRRILVKKKHKFHVPLVSWFRGPLYGFLRESLLSSDSTTLKMFEKSFVSGLIEHHKRGLYDYNRQLWALLFLEYWSETFKEEVAKRNRKMI